MKPFLLILLCSLPLTCAAADGVKLHNSHLTRIDLDLTLDQYKQARMEQFRMEMQLKLLQIDDAANDEETRQRKRLEQRWEILRNMANEVRDKAMRIEREFPGHSREEAKDLSPTGNEVGATTDGIQRRMLGTWQLVSFADGRVSEANAGELKFIGDRHWSVSRLEPGTGRLDYHMGDTYTLDGNDYVETVEYGTGGPTGETFTYKLTIENDQFTQMGVGNQWSLVFKRAK